MTNFHEFFQETYEALKISSYWGDMSSTVEGSPYHREANVAIHTDMVVKEFVHVNAAWTPWTLSDLAGALACMFHDIGKPKSLVVKFKPDRGEYKAFYGHEQQSSRMFLDYARQNHKIMQFVRDLGPKGPEFLFIVAWMIENHLPWKIIDPIKRRRLFRTIHQFDIHPTFSSVLISDTFGRISDDQEAKRRSALDWATKFDEDFEGVRAHYDYLKKEDARSLPGKKAYVLIGPSGSGKSTYVKGMSQAFETKFGFKPNLKYFSLDAQRHEFYGEDYASAFQKSTEDKHFKSRCNERFLEYVRDKDVDVVVVDNVNATEKSRAFYVTEFERRQFFTTAVVFSSTVKTVVDRQTTRTDKSVPEDVVVRQYYSIALPSLGEFDAIEHVLT